jgi:hypothetical protein
MNNFSIDDEIDKLVDKLADQLKIRLKKSVMRSEKQVLRQYIASQKETAKATKTSGGRKARKTETDSVSKVVSKKQAVRKTAPKREVDYGDSSGSELSESE